jgi:hypothetical protein
VARQGIENLNAYDFGVDFAEFSIEDFAALVNQDRIRHWAGPLWIEGVG